MKKPEMVVCQKHGFIHQKSAPCPQCQDYQCGEVWAGEKKKSIIERIKEAGLGRNNHHS
jgi:hypothetical protein